MGFIFKSIFKVKLLSFFVIAKNDLFYIMIESAKLELIDLLKMGL
jgi:hypothetical protein